MLMYLVGKINKARDGDEHDPCAMSELFSCDYDKHYSCCHRTNAVNHDTLKDLIEKDFVEREMVLVKVTATSGTREEILRVVDIFRGKVIDVGAKTYTIEVTGDEKKIDAILALLKPLGIKELVRTGRVAMIRGSKITTEPS